MYSETSSIPPTGTVECTHMYSETSSIPHPLGLLDCRVCILTCPSLTTGSGVVDEDKKNSTVPLYVNVEMDDGSVPMTTNPSYGKVELTSDHSRAVYANL